MVDFLAASEVLAIYQKRLRIANYGEIWFYRHASKLPVRGDQEAIATNWCERTFTRGQF
jgi:hypothetical protein